MKLLEKVDWNVLNTYIDNGLIISNKHPEYDLWILNYSPKTQSKKNWDAYTLSCRGLIIDGVGNIIARPFTKFFNLGEHDSSEIDMSKKFDVFEKVDGSLIILFYYEKRMEWIVASRGSFISEQSVEARKLIGRGMYDHFDIDYTYLFEYIAPNNRIVVNYGNLIDLVLLAKIETKTGDEKQYDELYAKYAKYFTIVKKHIVKIENLSDLKKLEEDNKEGFVVRFEDGFRVKVKFDEYVRLHGILTNVSNITVWEHLMNNYDFDSLIDRVPDEFYGWLNKTKKILQSEYDEIERLAMKDFIRIYHINQITDRKDFAMEAIKTNYRSILFRLYDKRPYDEIIWKSIRPKFSKPFKDGYN